MTDVRHRHHRDRDHFGEDYDLYVGLSAAIGPWEIGTPVSYVLKDLYDRHAALESGNHRIGGVSINAWVLAPGGFIGTGNIVGAIAINAWVKSGISGSVTINAEVAKGSRITINAWVRPRQSFTISAYVI